MKRSKWVAGCAEAVVDAKCALTEATYCTVQYVKLRMRRHARPQFKQKPATPAHGNMSI